MSKIYDVIIIGAGPAGLTAAKTAAEKGLKVILIERRKNITEVHRTCGQTFFFARKHVGATESGVYCYRDPVKLEIGPNKNRFVYPQGFSIDYKGPLVPYYHFTHFSPAGYQIDRYRMKNDDPWGFFYQRDLFLGGLFSSVEKAGVEILTETVGLGAENTSNGVKVRVRRKSREQILKARKAIAADGNNSVIVDSLGLNKDRTLLAPTMRLFGYVMEGLENVPRNSWLDFIIPSINPQTDIWIYMLEEDRMMVGTGPVSGSLSPKRIIEKFMKFPPYAPWFHHARVIKKTGCTTTIRTPIREPVVGNVVITGDAGAPYETLIQGAVACGYLAVKAIEKELKGQAGYPKYIRWWQNAFEFNDPTFFKTTARYMFLNKLCSDEEVDYLFRHYQGMVGVPQVIIAKNLGLIKKGRPELYERLNKMAIHRLGLEMADVWGDS